MEPSRPHRRPLLPPAQLPIPPAADEDVVVPMNGHPALRAASVAASTQVASAVAAAAAPNPFFNNQTPTLAYDPAENKVVDGHIEGNLHPVDPDSTKLKYTATKPALGTVVITPSGTFDYTPGRTTPDRTCSTSPSATPAADSTSTASPADQLVVLRAARHERTQEDRDRLHRGRAHRRRVRPDLCPWTSAFCPTDGSRCREGRRDQGHRADGTVLPSH